jgi:chromosome segregation ATPase
MRCLFLWQALHTKLVQEQESWTQELKAKQESLSKRSRILDAKEEEINNDLERLTEERRVALEDIKRLAEMETRAWGAERELQTKHDEHLKEVSFCVQHAHALISTSRMAKVSAEVSFMGKRFCDLDTKPNAGATY